MKQTVFGVSFSIKQCRAFGIDPKDTLDWLIKTAGFKRFRLMSYWNEHERRAGKYDFSQLDWQIERIQKAGGTVSLCLGARQPRWPENHWPDWAWDLPKAERTKALLAYIQAVVERYKNYSCVQSYQLENEALLKNFGRRPEVDRNRLVDELNLIKKLEPTRPIVMTTSNHWGIPIRQPVPDIVGFSYYHTVYARGAYHSAHHGFLLHRLRKLLVQLLLRRPVILHELQLEPWGPTAIWKMSTQEQDKSMSPAQIKRSIKLGRKTGLKTIDLWGAEWWYWRLKKQKDSRIWQAVSQAIAREIES